MFRTGLRFDGIEELASYATPDGPWVVLDLYHSFMAMPCDFSKVADRVFLMGGGYKYAMAGENAAYLHAPPGFAPRPLQTGWFADFGAMEGKQGEVGYNADGSRFLGATYDPTGLVSLQRNPPHARLAEGLDTAAISDTLRGLARADRDGDRKWRSWSVLRKRRIAEAERARRINRASSPCVIPKRWSGNRS
jgi:selenocysteine lyase/cysteine desulfurase